MSEHPNTLDAAFAFEDSQLALWGGKEMLRLEVLMDYSEPMFADSASVLGLAAVRWSILSDEFRNEISVREFKIILVASLYAKILTLDQLRAELFGRVGNALQACFASGDLSSLTFAPWHLRGRTIAGSFQNLVWPWKMATWSDVEARRHKASVKVGWTTMNVMKTHTATLLKGPAAPFAPAGSWLRYRLDQELTLVLVPACWLSR